MTTKQLVVENSIIIGEMPASPEAITVSVPADFDTMEKPLHCWEYVNGVVVLNEAKQTEYLDILYNLEPLRKQRKPILKAWDVYKGKVLYGEITETEERHTQLLSWIQSVLDLDKTSIENIPEEVAIFIE